MKCKDCKHYNHGQCMAYDAFITGKIPVPYTDKLTDITYDFKSFPDPDYSCAYGVKKLEKNL